jgi:hypothetical protein
MPSCPRVDRLVRRGLGSCCVAQFLHEMQHRPQLRQRTNSRQPAAARAFLPMERLTPLRFPAATQGIVARACKTALREVSVLLAALPDYATGPARRSFRPSSAYQLPYGCC